jgi:hypothetical protein
MLLMEMMDIRAAIRWLNESSDGMMVFGKSLESQPKGESDPLKRELIAAQRAAVEAFLNTSLVSARLIGEQVLLELPLLMGHSDQLTLHLIPIAGCTNAVIDQAIAERDYPLLQSVGGPLSVLTEFYVLTAPGSNGSAGPIQSVVKS